MPTDNPDKPLSFTPLLFSSSSAPKPPFINPFETPLPYGPSAEAIRADRVLMGLAAPTTADWTDHEYPESE